MGSSIFTGSGIEIYSNFRIRDQEIASKNGISLKKIYLATTLSCSKISIGKTLSTQCHIQKVLMIFKSLDGLAPEYLSSKFIARSNTIPYTFRDSVNKLTNSTATHKISP